MKRIFPWISLSVSRTGTFVEHKIVMFLYHQTYPSPSSWKVPVWSTISSKGFIGPILGTKKLLHSLPSILHEFVAVQNVSEEIVSILWFMQDGARQHRMDEVFHYLREHFEDQVVSLDYFNHTGSCMDWPSYSPVLNPWYLSLWRIRKSRCEWQFSTRTAELKPYISAACETFPCRL